MSSVTSAQPPDDAGSDAFRRFGYQAHVVFPLCLRLYFVGDIVAIYCEHWEDVLVEFVDRIRFMQIKTRDAGRGPWKYRHLLDDGGALRSLLRTHRALNDLSESQPIEYEICLEGAVDSTDVIARLLVSGDGADADMCDTCARRLEIDVAEAKALLARVTVTPGQPPRTLIAAANRDLLRLRAGELAANELNAVYDETIELIKRAMEADLLADAWPEAILAPESAAEEAKRRAAGKRLDRDRLKPILSRLEGGDQRLLAEVIDPKRLRATALERKLTDAGASTERPGGVPPAGIASLSRRVTRATPAPCRSFARTPMFETRIPRKSASCHAPKVSVKRPNKSRIPFGMLSVLARRMLALQSPRRCPVAAAHGETLPVE